MLSSFSLSSLVYFFYLNLDMLTDLDCLQTIITLFLISHLGGKRKHEITVSELGVEFLFNHVDFLLVVRTRFQFWYNC
jgi:hypothetical protein